MITSDTLNPSFPLYVSARAGSVPEALKVEPGRVDFERAFPDPPETSMVKLTNLGVEPMNVSIVDSPGDVVTASLNGATIRAGEAALLAVATRSAPRPPVGRVTASVTLLVDEARSTRITIPIKVVTTRP